jgi:hypothetical protein
LNAIASPEFYHYPGSIGSICARRTPSNLLSRQCV